MNTIDILKKCRFDLIINGETDKTSQIKRYEAEIILNSSKLKKILNEELFDMSFNSTFDLFKDQNGSDNHKKFFIETLYQDVVESWAIRKNNGKVFHYRGNFELQNFEEVKDLIIFFFE